MGILVFCRTLGNRHTRGLSLLESLLLTVGGSIESKKISYIQDSSRRRRQPSFRTHHKV